MGTRSGRRLDYHDVRTLPRNSDYRWVNYLMWARHQDVPSQHDTDRILSLGVRTSARFGRHQEIGRVAEPWRSLGWWVRFRFLHWRCRGQKHLGRSFYRFRCGLSWDSRISLQCFSCWKREKACRSQARHWVGLFIIDELWHGHLGWGQLWHYRSWLRRIRLDQVHQQWLWGRILGLVYRRILNPQQAPDPLVLTWNWFQPAASKLPSAPEELLKSIERLQPFKPVIPFTLKYFFFSFYFSN